MCRYYEVSLSTVHNSKKYHYFWSLRVLFTLNIIRIRASGIMKDDNPA